MSFLECVPAYGADYTSQAQVKAAWNASKDFQIVEYGPHYGQYVNKQDAQDDEKYMIRYAKLQKVIILP